MGRVEPVLCSVVWVRNFGTSPNFLTGRLPKNTDEKT